MIKLDWMGDNNMNLKGVKFDKARLALVVHHYHSFNHG